MTTATPPVMTVSNATIWRSFAHAEWIKLRTVRSTMYTLLAAAVIAIGICAIACQHLVSDLSGATIPLKGEFLVNPTDPNRSLVGTIVAQLAIGALGVLVVTSEYATGMIRASLCAMPQRLRWISAKFAVFTAVALVVGQVLTFTSFGIGQAILHIRHVGLSLGDPGALRIVVASGLYIALVGIMGAALGLIVKHTAGALVSLIAILFVLPGIISGAFSEPLQGHIMRFLPQNVGEQSITIARMSDHFSTWAGIALMVGYVAVLIAIGSALLRRRDA